MYTKSEEGIAKSYHQSVQVIHTYISPNILYYNVYSERELQVLMGGNHEFVG